MLKKAMIPLVLCALVACGKKEWSKEYMSNKCLSDFKKRNEKERIFTDSQIPVLCDCVAEKAVAKYKSEAELDRDEEGAREIGRSCAESMLSK